MMVICKPAVCYGPKEERRERRQKKLGLVYVYACMYVSAPEWECGPSLNQPFLFLFPIHFRHVSETGPIEQAGIFQFLSLYIYILFLTIRREHCSVTPLCGSPCFPVIIFHALRCFELPVTCFLELAWFACHRFKLNSCALYPLRDFT